MAAQADKLRIELAGGPLDGTFVFVSEPLPERVEVEEYRGKDVGKLVYRVETDELDTEHWAGYSPEESSWNGTL